jgi:hypothetical protein
LKISHVLQGRSLKSGIALANEAVKRMVVTARRKLHKELPQMQHKYALF